MPMPVIMGEAAAFLDMAVPMVPLLLPLLTMVMLLDIVLLLAMVLPLLGTVAIQGMVVADSLVMADLLLLRPCSNPLAKTYALLAKDVRTNLADQKEAVAKGAASLTVLPLRGKMVSFVRYARRRVTLPMNVGGVMVMMTMMMMTLLPRKRAPMVLTQIGIWILVLLIISRDN
jgi:hypothetical protein